MKQTNIEALRLFLSLGKELELKIISDSMEPLIHVGDKIRVRESPFQNLKLFDIILFSNGGNLYCHFVIHKNNSKNSIQAIGIRGQFPKRPITQEEYVGKVVNFHLGKFHKIYYLLHRTLLKWPK